MLVLTRKYQEKIRIGNNITITVLRMKGKAVRLGIEAPSDVPVLRGELSFEDEAQQAEESLDSIATVAFDDTKPIKQIACAGGTATATRWATARETEPKVGLSRVPRGKVAGLLPKLVVGDAPLRAMMDHKVSS